MTYNTFENVRLVVKDRAREPQDTSWIGSDENCLLDLLAEFDPYGVWRLDLETATAEWSPDCLRILGVGDGEAEGGLLTLLQAIHPDDRKTVASCFDHAITQRSAFRFVLRGWPDNDEVKLIKMAGKFRVSPAGREEIVGTLSQFQDRVPAVGLLGVAAATDAASVPVADR